ncbi:class I SAM-dependent RNA methyltransferase [Bdellovibrio sp. HCB337]|uniref:class I SAM-dependent RNA methyltransferase n=1 Tax=Bdellovibrio sp. HCB337 TaxID=3394358 RepID=UPI0039A543B6
MSSQLTVTIDKLAIGGAGVARHDGLVIFVPDAAPGDELLIEITTKKKNFAEAQIVKVLKPGPSRRTPPCPIADRCGGCNWQHLTEDEQRRQKQLMVQETLAKFLPGMDLPFLPLKESPLSLRYRNRIQPKYSRGRFGFFARRSHEIVEAKDCPITEEKLTNEFAKIKAELDKKFRDTKETQRLEIYLDQSETPKWLLMGEEKEGVGFSQVNRFQNEDLIKTVLEWSEGADYERIFDFYAGGGNFTFPLAEKYRTQQIVAAELDSKLVQKAHEKIQAAGSLNKRMHYYLSDVASFMRRTQFQSKDLVLLDPPRAGADEYVMKALAQGSVAKIIYISCHPVSLARDLKYFFEAQAARSSSKPLKLKKIQCFEMFPQTDHVETIAELAVDTP